MQLAGIEALAATADHFGSRTREATEPPRGSPKAIGAAATPSSLPDRYIVEPEGDCGRRVERAISLALAIARVEGSGVSLLAPSASPLVISALGAILPLDQRMTLVLRGSAEAFGVPLRLESSRAIDGRCDRVVVVAWAVEELLATVDAMTGRGAIIAVPRWPGDCQAWRQRWSPMVVVADG